MPNSSTKTATIAISPKSQKTRWLSIAELRKIYSQVGRVVPCPTKGRPNAFQVFNEAAGRPFPLYLSCARRAQIQWGMHGDRYLRIAEFARRPVEHDCLNCVRSQVLPGGETILCRELSVTIATNDTPKVGRDCAHFTK